MMWLALVVLLPAAEATVVVHIEGAPATVADQVSGAVARQGRVVEHAAFARALASAGVKMPLADRIDKARRGGRANAALLRAAEQAGAKLMVLARFEHGRKSQSLILVALEVAGGAVVADSTLSVNSRKQLADPNRLRGLLATAFSRLEHSAPVNAPTRVAERSAAADEAPAAVASSGDSAWGDVPLWAAPQPNERASRDERDEGEETRAVEPVAESPKVAARKNVRPAHDEVSDAPPAYVFQPGRSAARKPEAVSAPSVSEQVDAKPLAIAELALEAGLGGRRFTYNDPWSTNLRPYNAAGIQLAGAEARLFPFPASSRPLLHRLGVQLDFMQAKAFPSTVAGDESGGITTSWRHWRAGLCERLGRNLHVAATYGELAFGFTAPNDGLLTEALPDVHYRYLALALGAQVELSALRLSAEIGGQHLMSSGVVDDYFPNARARAVEGELSIAYPLAVGFEVRAALHYMRVFYDLLPEPGDRYVAGGALDQFGHAAVGLVYGM